MLAFNEEANIEAAIATVMKAAAAVALEDFEIIAVNDGSTDRTGELLAERARQDPRIRVVVNEVNGGMGVSVRRGLEIAKYGQFLLVPGDNDLSFEMIRLLLRYRNAADVVLAFPINTEDRSLWRNILSVMYRLIHVATFRVFVNYINAPGICPTATLRALPLHSRRFSIIAEYNVKLLRSGCTFAEVPGFVQNAERKGRRTVTFKNFVEVVRSFLRLCVEIHVKDRARYSGKPRRVFIDFAEQSAASPASPRGEMV